MLRRANGAALQDDSVGAHIWHFIEPFSWEGNRCLRRNPLLKKWSGTLADFEPHSAASHLPQVVSGQEGS